MVGFTPKVSAAVWVGTDKPQAMTTVQGNQIYGRTLPGMTWQRFMNGYLAGTPQDELTDEVEVNPSYRPAPQVTATKAEPSPTPDADQDPAPQAAADAVADPAADHGTGPDRHPGRADADAVTDPAPGPAPGRRCLPARRDPRSAAGSDRPARPGAVATRRRTGDGRSCRRGTTRWSGWPAGRSVARGAGTARSGCAGSGRRCGCCSR